MTDKQTLEAVLKLAADWERQARTEQFGAIAGTLRECADQIKKLVKQQAMVYRKEELPPTNKIKVTPRGRKSKTTWKESL